MQALTNKTASKLRGGGCGCFRIVPDTQRNLKLDIQDIENFIIRFDSYVEKICTKAAVAANQSESQEIMLAIQWFIFQEENIYKLNKNDQIVMKSYTLIVEGIRKLLKSCLIYIRTDQFKCLYILQITTSLSKVIFSFHIMNGKRFMECDLQKEFLEISDELKQQMEIEKNDLIQVQMELYLFLTKTSFYIAPNNSNEREDILKGCLSGIIDSIIQMKPSAKLLESLFQGACQLHKMYAVQKNREQYEVYFQIDMLQWEIISYFRKEKEQNLEEIISQIQTINEKLVKCSNNWYDHYFWVEMIGKILSYNPIIRKNRLKKVGIDGNEVWQDYLKKRILINTNYSKDSAILLIDEFSNKKLQEIDKLILQDFFFGWENFIFLKKILMQQQKNQIQSYTLESYLQKTLNIGNDNFEKNVELLIKDKTQQLFSFIVPTNLLNLLKQNNKKLQIILRSLRIIFDNFDTSDTNDTKVDLLSKKTLNSQFQNIISSLEEYSSNIIKIMTIFNLSKNNNQIKEVKQMNNQFKTKIQLVYLLRLLDVYLKQKVQIHEHKNTGKEKSIAEVDEFYLEQLKQIISQIQTLTYPLQNQKQLNQLNQKILNLLNDWSDQKKVKQESLDLMQFIEKEFKKLFNSSFVSNNLVQDGQNLIQLTFQFYQDESQKLEEVLKEILNLKNSYTRFLIEEKHKKCEIKKYSYQNQIGSKKYTQNQGFLRNYSIIFWRMPKEINFLSCQNSSVLMYFYLMYC